MFGQFVALQPYQTLIGNFSLQISVLDSGVELLIISLNELFSPAVVQ